MPRRFLIVIQDGNARRWYAVTEGKDLEQAKGRVMTRIQAHNARLCGAAGRYLRRQGTNSIACPIKTVLAGDMEVIEVLTGYGTATGLMLLASKLGAEPLQEVNHE